MPISGSLPPAIMFQGTASNAGKSILTAGLCRILARRGLKVAPFKAQNMSLNSWVAHGGREMGVAQALQARACGLEPDPRMNPVLLKPMGDAGSQVLVLGEPIGIMPYGEYVRQKPRIWSAICEAYASLAAGRDAIILEGAGSPAEINLRGHDVVNMRMAHYARASVLLAADIDLGGAFASLVGTLALLDPADQQLVKAFVLNKFRGDASLLTPALEEISCRWHRPFAGIVPLLPLHLPQEDSAGSNLSQSASPAGCLDVAIIELPAMSNLADFDPLLAEPGVHCRLVRHGRDLGAPHAVILPGSRNGPHAMEHLRCHGLVDALSAYAAACEASGKGQLIGICAGLELLGETLDDRHCIEAGGVHECLGLLPLKTTLAREKTLSRVKAVAGHPICQEPTPCEGNEIHHGLAQPGIPAAIIGNGGQALGWAKGPAWGTWLHGIFDGDQFRHNWLKELARQWGKPAPPCVPFTLEPELDKLADALEEALDMELIYSLLGLG